MKYSQNNEEQYILNYFRGFTGRFLDIGAYDGIKYSNTYALLKRGWHGDYVDASDKIFKKLCDNIRMFPNVRVGKFAIGTENKKISFWDNDNAVATAIESELERWPDEEFNKIEVDCKRFDSVWGENHKFQFISIDIEGFDVEVLKQIDIDKHDCRCICIEWNSKDEVFNEIDTYLKGFNMKLIHKNMENVIYVKK